jgi:putative endonuclease
MVERPAVNGKVAGSSPARGVPLRAARFVGLLPLSFLHNPLLSRSNHMGRSSRQRAQWERGAMFYVYILKSERNGRLYNGFTSDLKNRLQQHNAGESFATRPYVPWKLVFYLAFQSEDLAKNFERYLKTGSGAAFAKKRFLIQ